MSKQLSTFDKLQYLQNQSEAMSYLFEHIDITKIAIEKLKELRTKGKLERKYILQIENKLDQLNLLIQTFNEGDFTLIMKNRLDESLQNVLYGFKKPINRISFEEIRLPVIKKKKTNSKRQFKPEVSQE